MRTSALRHIGLAMSVLFLAFLVPATSHAATLNSGSMGYSALAAQAASSVNASIARSSSIAVAAAASQNSASCSKGTCTITLDHASTQALITLINATPKLQLLAALFNFCNRFSAVAIRAACSVLAAGIVLEAPALAQQMSDEDMGNGVYISFSVTDIHKIGSTPQPAPVPYITQVSTYTQGVFVYFRISYADPGHNAEGFGFVGVNGSGWAEENHPFSSPSYGIVGPNRIDYPFNQGCGTGQQADSYVEAWIYDTAGVRSQPVTIHLVCTTAGTAG
jgi:hypothetical protein